MSQHSIITIEEVPPHKGKPMTKIAISPQSRYVVTYSQEDESFVGWCSKNTRKEDSTAKCINIHSLIGFLFGNKVGQDHKDDDNNDYSGQLIVDSEVKQYNLDLDVSDYKVSDNKIIIYEDSDELAIIYNMKNEEKILLNSSLNTDYKYKFNFPCYKFTNFLTNGDLATYNIIESKGSKNPTISGKPVLLIYSLNVKDNIWECKYIHEFDNMNEIEISCGGITNDRLWTLSKNTIFILDLLTFQYRKIPLEIKEKVIDTKMIELKFLKSLMVISIKGRHYIYSDRMDFPIKIIEGSNLENSIKYNNLIKSFLETNDNPNYFSYFNNILFRLNDQKVFGIFYEKPWMINMKKCDLETYIINDNYIDTEEISDIKDSINENIFYNIGNQFTTTQDENEFIKKYIIPNLVNSNENQNEYHMRLTNKGGEFILEAFINNLSQNRPLASYNIRGPNWNHVLVNNTNILYDGTELHIYTFNIEFRKIELKLCYNLKFLKYAIKLYNSNKPDALGIVEIKEIAQPATNELKKQWILYATNQKYFLAFFFTFTHDTDIILYCTLDVITIIILSFMKYWKPHPPLEILEITDTINFHDMYCFHCQSKISKYYDCNEYIRKKIS
ncbi:unnamed protein product [Rhizophagus irregularis]|nr:unnamed protein product [Rhizophagus irregularis]